MIENHLRVFYSRLEAIVRLHDARPASEFYLSWPSVGLPVALLWLDSCRPRPYLCNQKNASPAEVLLLSLALYSLALDSHSSNLFFPLNLILVSSPRCLINSVTSTTHGSTRTTDDGRISTAGPTTPAGCPISMDIRTRMVFILSNR